MSSTNVTVVDRDGEIHEDVPWDEDQSLMEAIRDADLPVLASCGGCCSCATCHVYVDTSRVSKPAAGEELELLTDAEGFDPTCSRLSCQIPFEQRHEGMRVVLAPED